MSHWPKMARYKLVVWKFEDGPVDAPKQGSPHDFGPAWLDTYTGNQVVASRKLNRGEWLTRAEAKRLAAKNGWDIEFDD